MNIKPYKDESLNVIYNGIFCDLPELYTTAALQPADYPWNVLLDKGAAEESLLAVAADPAVESRIKLLVYHQLRQKGFHIDSKELLGVIIEVRFENGLDVVAAFKDGTARYINQAEKLIIWETTTAESEKLIYNLFSESLKVVSKIGAWDKPRLAQPGIDDVRISFLVADGLYFGQGPFDALAKDAMGGPVIQAAGQLMLFLTDKVLAKAE